MEQMKKKLVMAGLSLTVAVVLMVTASMAWMTISTKPEISGMEVQLYTKRTLLSSDDGEKFVQYLDLSQQFVNLAPLHPTSTVDGIHWFIPAYKEEVWNPDDNNYDGGLKDASEFLLASEENNANVSLVDERGNLLEEAELREAVARSYYVYTDFWLKTEEEEGCNVRLSVPRNTDDALDPTEKSGENSGKYGSYVLAGREYLKVGGQDAKSLTKKETESCVRVGFLIDPDDESTDYQTKFIIYEPNADQRSGDGKAEGGEYVLDYEFNSASYVDGNYIQTKPIGIDNENKGKVSSVDPKQLIIQKKSVWNEESANGALGNGASLSSNEVNTLGKFISAQEIYSKNATAVSVEEMDESIASDVIVTLKEEKPVKVRMFIWLEGQDVDCWNDISAGSFIVNLELAGESLTQTDAG